MLTIKSADLFLGFILTKIPCANWKHLKSQNKADSVV